MEAAIIFPFVSRRAYEWVVIDRARLLEEISSLKAKCEKQENAILRSSQSVAAAEYLRNNEPAAEQTHVISPPPPGCSWETYAQYMIEVDEAEQQTKGKQNS